jgi:aminoglycoside phosphotransferase (APT) family kinase protein
MDLYYLVMTHDAHKSPVFSIGEVLSDLSQEHISSLMQTDDYTIQPVTGGLSGAKLYKVRVNAHDYLIRYTSGIFGRQEIHQEFYLQETMCHQHVTPTVHYANPDQGIIVMDFIDNQFPKGRSPSILNNIPNGVVRTIELMKTLHSTPCDINRLSYRVAKDYITYSHAGLPEAFLQSSYLDVIKAYIKKSWPEDQVVVTHNDFRSDNLLFNQTFQLIDWELAGLSHPWYDLAYFCNYQATSHDQSADFFELYLERRPNEKELSTFRTLRGFAFVFSAVLCLPGLAADGFKPLQQHYECLSHCSIQNVWQQMDAGHLNMDNEADEFSISMRLLIEASHYL